MPLLTAGDENTGPAVVNFHWAGETRNKGARSLTTHPGKQTGDNEADAKTNNEADVKT